MTENNKIYITASELADMLGVSVGHAYKLMASWLCFMGVGTKAAFCVRGMEGRQL